MQILFEDLTLQEAKIVVDALDNHRKLVVKTEQEAKQALVEERRKVAEAVGAQVFCNTNTENGLEGRWITKIYPATNPTLESEEFLREQIKMTREAQQREVERTGDLSTPLRLNNGCTIWR
jgi:N-acetylmuramoyl-L-alanine amidase